MKIFLDDERQEPTGWRRTYSVEETKQLLLTRTCSHVSLDNDLGSLDPQEEGHKILDWLEEQVFHDPTFPIPQIAIHTANSSRHQYMRQVVAKLWDIRRQQIGGE